MIFLICYADIHQFVGEDILKTSFVLVKTAYIFSQSREEEYSSLVNVAFQIFVLAGSHGALGFCWACLSTTFIRFVVKWIFYGHVNALAPAGLNQYISNQSTWTSNILPFIKSLYCSHSLMETVALKWYKQYRDEMRMH